MTKLKLRYGTEHKVLQKKKEIKMKKISKICSTSLVIKEMQARTTLRFPLIQNG